MDHRGWARLSIPPTQQERKAVFQERRQALFEAGAETIEVNPEYMPYLLEGDPATAAFFVGDSDAFPPFELPDEEDDPRHPTDRTDGILQRLFMFAHLVRPFDWTEDPRREPWQRLLASLRAGAPDAQVEGKTQDLWDCMLGVARNERFCEGVLLEHSHALTRIANELRRRLMGRTAG